jgi:hypothetical protein
LEEIEMKTNMLRAFIMGGLVLAVACGGSDDTDPTTCEPVCAADEYCHDGTCMKDVDMCMPACADGDLCVNGICESGPPIMTNQCTNDADMVVLEDKTLGDTAKACGLACVTNDDPGACSLECITTETNLSEGCSGCLAATIVCTFDKCADECIATLEGAACDACQAEAGCIAGFETCSGITQPSGDPEADCEAAGGTWNAEDETCTVTSSSCDPPCEDNGSCIEGVCVPNPPALCDPPCTDGENCENGTCVLDPTMVGAVPTSCGSPQQNLEPVDCTKNGDTNAQCVFSNHCMCSAADGFVCDNNGTDDSPDCAAGISCVPDLSKVGMVPTSCGSPDQGLGPVDCTKYGDKNAQCIWGSFCTCSVVDGFECEEVLAGGGSQCVVGSSCVPVTPSGSKTLTEIFEPVFQNKGCTAGYCHGGSVDELLLSDVDSIFANLVNQAASIPACGLTLRVVPGNPEESILWHRVKPMADGEDPCVSKMPKGSNGLSEEDAQLVYDWILGGALQ